MAHTAFLSYLILSWALPSTFKMAHGCVCMHASLFFHSCVPWLLFPYTLPLILWLFISKKSRLKEGHLELTARLSLFHWLILLQLLLCPHLPLTMLTSLPLLNIRKITQHSCPNSSFRGVFTQLQIEEVDRFPIIFIWKGHTYGHEGQIELWCYSHWSKKGSRHTHFKRKW